MRGLKKTKILGSILLFLGSTIFMNKTADIIFPLTLIILGNIILIIGIHKNNYGIINLLLVNTLITIYYLIFRNMNLGLFNNVVIALIIFTFTYIEIKKISV